MATRRAGRTPAHGERGAPSPLPSAAIPARPAAPTTRRRAALSHGGHAATDMSGFDGEVCVRYEAVYRRAEPACGERRLLLAVLEDGIRTFLKNARATHGRAFNLRREALTWLTRTTAATCSPSRTSVRRSASMRAGCASGCSARRPTASCRPCTERRPRARGI